MNLPESIIADADLRGNEFAWKPTDFPRALAEATRLGFLCGGGQFQFRLPRATCEMYWLQSTRPGRHAHEAWLSFVARCAASVGADFQQLLDTTDFRREAESWACIRDLMTTEKVDAMAYLVFVAYFEDEQEYRFSCG